MAKIEPIEHSFYLPISPDKVYEYLTKSKLLTGWFSERAIVTPKKGGSFQLFWGEFAMRGKVKEAVAPKKLVIAWIDRFENAKVFETEARFTLRKKGKGTLLKITHSGFKSGKKWTVLYGAISSGWAYYLLNLRSVVEHGTDLRNDFDAL